jgi:uncharacterized protein YoxC
VWEALVFLLQASVEALKALREYVIVPSIENKQKLEDSLRKLRRAYQYFVEKMNQVEADLLEGKFEKVKTDIEAYDSKLDTAFNNVEEASEEVVTEFERSRFENLSSNADSLFETAKDMRKLWVAFKQEVRSNNTNQARNILRQTCNRVEKHVTTMENLASAVKEESESNSGTMSMGA